MSNRVVESLISSADAIFPLLTAFLALQIEWTLYDDISTHVKVYQCTGGATTFYMEVDNTTAEVLIIKLATGWDIVEHVYMGYKSLAQWMALPAGDYTVLGDHETLLITNLLPDNMDSIYVGFIVPLDYNDVNSIILSGRLSLGGASGMLNPDNTTHLWLFNRLSGNGGIIQCVQDSQAIYSYNVTTGQIYLQRIHLGSDDEPELYRGYPKFLHNTSFPLPSQQLVGNVIKVGGKDCKLKMTGTTVGALWHQWEA